ncbi:hypothetical protein RESH_00799 [Rhodopirellula europaea SH398]|uniref:Uncharacterized protein n=1 Tax=Rhodopirellula europaea SH398 TaxID=1263868 RepID=M5SLK4_9BACT|nr:hypothetical protein RESH_00799 [Rhodopirellula europaea SH398]
MGTLARQSGEYHSPAVVGPRRHAQQVAVAHRPVRWASKPVEMAPTRFGLLIES